MGSLNRKLKRNQPVEQVIRTKRLEIIDAQGRPRAILTAINERDVGLALTDERSKSRLILAFSDEAVGLNVMDANGKTRLFVGLAKNCPTLTIFDKKGNIQKSAQFLHPQEESVSADKSNGEVSH
jgi:hypothetical protein